MTETLNRSAMSVELTPIERAMLWERMSGEQLSVAERRHILAGGDFTPPTAASHRAEAKTRRRETAELSDNAVVGEIADIVFKSVVRCSQEDSWAVARKVFEHLKALGVI